MSAPHILIAGGGMVGLSLALLLHKTLPETAQVTLVEGVALPDGPDGADHPSFDARCTALSFSSATIYRELDLWPRLESTLAPIECIHVSRRARFGSSLLSAREQRWEALGWVVDNAALGRALLDALRGCARVTLRCPARVAEARADGRGMQVEIDGERRACDLLVIAEGARSALRDGLGFLTRHRPYAQRALIANLSFEQHHEGCAFERFTASGPLALLPLVATPAARTRMALVWTLPPQEAERLEVAGEADFTAALQDAFGHRLGRVRRVGRRASYPLALTEAVEQARRGCVLLGNAAHALHPVAGQGFNLALRDAAALADTLGAALRRRVAVGDTAVLRAYLEARARDQAQTIGASHVLPALFMRNDALLAVGRDLALAGLDLAPALRRAFVRQAAGMAGLQRA